MMDSGNNEIRELMECLGKAMAETEAILEAPGEGRERCIASLKELAESLGKVSEASIEEAQPEAFELTDEIFRGEETETDPEDGTVELKKQLITDKKFLPYMESEAERLSVISTLVAFRLSCAKGLPKHSQEYMDWCAQLRMEISGYFGTDVKSYS